MQFIGSQRLCDEGGVEQLQLGYAVFFGTDEGLAGCRSAHCNHHVLPSEDRRVFSVPAKKTKLDSVSSTPSCVDVLDFLVFPVNPVQAVRTGDGPGAAPELCPSTVCRQSTGRAHCSLAGRVGVVLRGWSCLCLSSLAAFGRGCTILKPCSNQLMVSVSQTTLLVNSQE